MGSVNEFLEKIVGIVWGIPMVFILIGGGIFFTVYFGFVQIRLFRHAIDVVRGKYDNPNDPGEINHFKALCTALSGTVGLGNIAGVAVAIKTGGPGATFWMIVAGLIGMATKFTECTLAVKFRQQDEDGHVHGGAMYFIEKGLGEKYKPLCYFFAFCCVMAAIGASGMFQSNQVAAIFDSNFNISRHITGVVLALLTAAVIIGGIKRIGSVAGTLVPFMGVSYILACIVIIVLNISELPGVVYGILTAAFSGTAAVGGFLGAGVKEVLIQGIRRAVFSNEAGLGTAAIAHSAAKTDEPIREGVVACLEPFIDTVVICTMTALVLNITGVWQSPENGVGLTSLAFDHSLKGLGTYFIPLAVFLFAFSTLISWSYYGEQAVTYLFGKKSINFYKIAFCLSAYVGSIWELKPVINFADIVFALMVIPNMFALLMLSSLVKKELNSYVTKLKNGTFIKYS